MAHTVALRPSEKRRLLKDLEQATRDASRWAEALKTYSKGTLAYAKIEESLDRAQQAKKRILALLGRTQ